MKPFNQIVLLSIDVQKAFDDQKWGVRNQPQAEDNIAKLFNQWRAAGRQIIHIKHQSDQTDSLFHPSKVTSDFKDNVKPLENEIILTKKKNSAFIGTNLEAILTEKQIYRVVIVGLTTAHCVSTTARMSNNLGFETIVVSDATAAFALKDHLRNLIDAETVHSLSLATLHDEFATILTTEDMIEDCKRARESID